MSDFTSRLFKAPKMQAAYSDTGKLNAASAERINGFLNTSFTMRRALLSL